MPKYIDVDSAAYDYSTLADWLISSVGSEPPVWTEQHIDELIEDFYIVPKSTPLADAVEVVRCADCEYFSEPGWCENPNTFAILTRGNTSPNWFCADGKRKDGGHD